MSKTYLDHITVTAFSLQAGASFVSEVLGVSPQVGGEHPRMGTHNLLLRLGDATFLEIIAPDPAAQPPSRPRWFALDSLGPQSQPALSTWVIRTFDIQPAAAGASEALGSIESMSRGATHWLMTIPEDGSVSLDGVAPALIEWRTSVHPAAHLEDKGLSLAQLEVVHPRPTRVAALLESLGLDAPVTVRTASPGEPAHLVAHINTPQGRRKLSVPSPWSQTSTS